MAGVFLHSIPEPSLTAWLSLSDQLQRILGEDLVAIWAHGGTMAVEEGFHRADLDTYVLLARRPDVGTVAAIEAAQDAIARGQGVEWDTWYVLAADAGGHEPPSHAFRERRRDTSWAIHRSHWLAGKYVALHGPEPPDVVPAPAWPELEQELDRELEHLERHVVEGDTDPFEATYAILNGSRILYAVETRNVVISKRAAGTWALDHVQGGWHPVLRAATRAYDGQASPDDAELLASDMAPFVSFVRDHLTPRVRSPDASPRWSGY